MSCLFDAVCLSYYKRLPRKCVNQLFSICLLKKSTRNACRAKRSKVVYMRTSDSCFQLCRKVLRAPFGPSEARSNRHRSGKLVKHVVFERQRGGRLVKYMALTVREAKQSINISFRPTWNRAEHALRANMLWNMCFWNYVESARCLLGGGSNQVRFCDFGRPNKHDIVSCFPQPRGDFRSDSVQGAFLSRNRDPIFERQKANVS